MQQGAMTDLTVEVGVSLAVRALPTTTVVRPAAVSDVRGEVASLYEEVSVVWPELDHRSGGGEVLT